MTLELDSSALPTLATNCVLVGHAEKADVVWTRDDFMALCKHMMNGNERNFFLIPYRKEDGTARFAKAKKAQADRRASWAWDTISGRAKNPASIGFYPRSADEKTCWGAMDFDGSDGHGNGNDESARDKALKAFCLLLRHPQLFVVLCTSGSSGWHLYAFTSDLHLVQDWIRLLKQAATMIGAEIRKGECEIFPSDTRGRIGYGIRAPGTWNPKHDAFSLIAFENVGPLLSALAVKEERKRVSLSSRSNNGVERTDLTYRNEKSVYRGEFDDWQTRFAITESRTRHEKLKALVGHIFRQVGRGVARQNAELQYNEKTVRTVAELSEHLQEFNELWDWFEKQWREELSNLECVKFAALPKDSNDAEAFRIIRSFAQLANLEQDFKIVAEHLAKRLGVTLQTACNIRRRYCEAEILVQTAFYKPNVVAARYCWLVAQSNSNGWHP